MRRARPMSQTCDVRCRCGDVKGRLSNASPDTVNRVVCYCDDCQAFAHFLGRGDLLDDHGGTDIVQVAPRALWLTHGEQHMACLRLSPKGLYRFYARCCSTPMGNTLGTKVPFVGIVASSVVEADAAVGPATGAILGRFAVGAPPAGSDKLDVGLLARAAKRVLSWKLRGQGTPHPYFAEGTPRFPVTVLTKDERAALRPLCGPVATSVRR